MITGIEDWEDWDNLSCDDLTIMIKTIPTEEQLKQIEDRKLVEESEKILINDLFEKPPNIQPNMQKQETNMQKLQDPNHKNIDKYNRKNEHELRQKEDAKIMLDIKLKQRKFIEIYGEATNIYNYDDYEDKIF
jgi:hypothetical protein